MTIRFLRGGEEAAESHLAGLTCEKEGGYLIGKELGAAPR